MSTIVLCAVLLLAALLGAFCGGLIVAAMVERRPIEWSDRRDADDVAPVVRQLRSVPRRRRAA